MDRFKSNEITFSPRSQLAETAAVNKKFTIFFVPLTTILRSKLYIYPVHVGLSISGANRTNLELTFI
jgi:hypothetical protein